MCINCLRLSLSGLVEVILCVCCRQSTGRAKKVTHPLEKIDISGTVVNFYSKLKVLTLTLYITSLILKSPDLNPLDCEVQYWDAKTNQYCRAEDYTLLQYGMISHRSSLIRQSCHFDRDFDFVLLQDYSSGLDVLNLLYNACHCGCQQTNKGTCSLCQSYCMLMNQSPIPNKKAVL